MTRAADILELVSTMKAKGAPFALATVVRTVSVTAAKAGAKAVILPDGSITEGWIGGGCARAAVLKAAKSRLPTATFASSRSSRRISSPSSASRRARNAPECVLPGTPVRAREPWTSSSSRCCRRRRS